VEKEIWKPIKGYENLYEASNLGRVKSLVREYTTGNGAKQKRSTIIMKSHINGRGYLSLTLHKNGKGKTYRVHKLIAETFLGATDLEVNHKNGIKTHNASDNLEYCTRSENMKHAYRCGLKTFEREQRGERNCSAVLSKKNVLAIYKMWHKFKIKQRIIALRFKVSPSTVNDIIKGRRWAHVSYNI
jgi:hypothetical protein